MKKLFTLFAATALSAMIFASCTKCTTCSYQYQIAGKDSVKTYPEQCGNKKVLDNYRSTVNAAAATDNGATVTCTDSK